MTYATTIARGRAVKDIADALADRHSYVLHVDPALNQDASAALEGIDATTYIDNGTDIALKTDQSAVLAVTSMLVPSAAVVLVPKTVAPALLSEALGRPIPDDGSQDIIFLHSTAESEPTTWSLLFLDALDRVDAVLASQIRAAEVIQGN